MTIRASQNPSLGFVPGDHVCAFCSGSRNVLDDIVVDYITKGLTAGNKVFCMVAVGDESGTIMHALRTHPRVYVNGILIDNPHYQADPLPG